MIALAIATGISPDEWAAMGSRAIDTAVELLKDKNSNKTDDEGRQMSG